MVYAELVDACQRTDIADSSAASIVAVQQRRASKRAEREQPVVVCSSCNCKAPFFLFGRSVDFFFLNSLGLGTLLDCVLVVADRVRSDILGFR